MVSGFKGPKNPINGRLGTWVLGFRIVMRSGVWVCSICLTLRSFRFCVTLGFRF